MTVAASRTPDEDLATRARSLAWYHTFEFPDGTVTDGYFDLRPVVRKLPLPASLAGKRCLDVASADGFFAIEMARRGGDVVSVDLADTTRQDWQGPPGANATRRQSTGRARQAFEIACEAFGVSIERHDHSLYEISEERLGTFDFVFMGNILMHLADPGRGLRAVRDVVGSGGVLLSFEGISLPLTALRPFTPSAQLWDADDPRWWTHNRKGHLRLLEAGGFRVVDSAGPFFAPLGAFHPRLPSRLPRRPREWAYWLFTRQFGGASAWALAEPRDLDGA